MAFAGADEGLFALVDCCCNGAAGAAAVWIDTWYFSPLLRCLWAFNIVNTPRTVPKTTTPAAIEPTMMMTCLLWSLSDPGMGTCV